MQPREHWGDGSVANSICRSTEDPPYFLVPTRQFTIISYSSWEIQHPLLVPLVQRLHMVHIQTSRQNTLMFHFEKLQTTQTDNFYFQLFFMKLIFKNIKSFKVINLSTFMCECTHGGVRSVFMFPSCPLHFKNQLLHLSWVEGELQYTCLRWKTTCRTKFSPRTHVSQRLNPGH